MPTVQFIGRVFPSVLNITFTDLPIVNWENKDNDLTMSFRLEVDNSIVRVICDVNRYGVDMTLELYMPAFDLARAVVDLACFSTGLGATVLFETVITPDGISSQLFTKIPTLIGQCTAYQMSAAPNENLTKVLQIVLKEPPLFMALNDLITAMSVPHHSSVTCARAIERLRNIATPGASRKESWELLRRKLNIERNYLEFVTNYPTGPRHGDPEPVPGEVNESVSGV